MTDNQSWCIRVRAPHHLCRPRPRICQVTSPGVPKTGTPGTKKAQIIPGVPKSGTPETPPTRNHSSRARLTPILCPAPGYFVCRARFGPFLCPATRFFAPRARLTPILCPATRFFLSRAATALVGNGHSVREPIALGRRSPVTAGRDVRRWCQILPGPHLSLPVTPRIFSGGARFCPNDYVSTEGSFL